MKDERGSFIISPLLHHETRCHCRLSSLTLSVSAGGVVFPFMYSSTSFACSRFLTAITTTCASGRSSTTSIGVTVKKTKEPLEGCVVLYFSHVARERREQESDWEEEDEEREYNATRHVPLGSEERQSVHDVTHLVLLPPPFFSLLISFCSYFLLLSLCIFIFTPWFLSHRVLVLLRKHLFTQSFLTDSNLSYHFRLLLHSSIPVSTN